MPGKLYPEDLAKVIRADGGGKYRPSNGTEGEMFQALWCERCKADAAFLAQMAGNVRGPAESGCEIISSALAFYEDDEFYPKEWVYDADGQPSCTAFDDIDAEKPDRTMDLFGKVEE